MAFEIQGPKLAPVFCRPSAMSGLKTSSSSSSMAQQLQEGQNGLPPPTRVVTRICGGRTVLAANSKDECAPEPPGAPGKERMTPCPRYVLSLTTNRSLLESPSDVVSLSSDLPRGWWSP